MFVSPADTLNLINVKDDRIIVSEKVLKPTDQFSGIIAKNKQIYGLYQTIIGEVNLGIWNMDFSSVSLISRLDSSKVSIKVYRSLLFPKMIQT